MKFFNLILVVFLFLILAKTSSIFCQNIDGLEVRGALVSTQFNSLEELKKVVDIKYITTPTGGTAAFLSHTSNGKTVTSLLGSGVSEKDFVAAKNGGFWERMSLLFKSPYSVMKREELQAVFTLAKRRQKYYGEGDPAFYDISKKILSHVSKEDIGLLNKKDLKSEKGYFNTINHITAQAFMTTIFSENLADLVADAHERKNLIELVDGNFTPEQIADLETGPLDNYVDMINNEWGQELGKTLKKKFQITPQSKWDNKLLADYLNELQNYYSWSFQIGFSPFRPNDDVLVKFLHKMNIVLSGN